MVGRLWTRQELIEALRLYCVTPFGKIHAKNPEINSLAVTLGRTPNSVALKMVNFASLDPTIDQAGMSNVSKLDREVWDEFFTQLMEGEAEEKPMGFGEDELPAFEYSELSGFNVPTLANRRINQDYFRRLVLASYNGRCAATGIDSSELLVAGHIIPWSKNQQLRVSPANGICLNNLFDKAFDRGLITIGAELDIIYSDRLPIETVSIMRKISFDKIKLPNRFRPMTEYFELHRQEYFR